MIGHFDLEMLIQQSTFIRISLFLFYAHALSAATYTYDLGGRLTGVVYTDSKKANYAYDAAGNVFNISTNATIIDTTAPSVEIVSPTNGITLPGVLTTVSGTASDDHQVTGVFCSLNGNAWQVVSTADAWAHWRTLVTLIPGTNTFRVYGIDAAGNFSATNSINLIYSQPGPRISPPTISANTKTFFFGWDGFPAQQYQIQYSTNLMSGTWINLGSAISSTNGTGFSPAISLTNKEQYFRVLQTQ